MKKVYLLLAFLTAAVGLSAQNSKGDKSVMAQIGYQSDYERLMIGAQGRYNIIDNLRFAPDMMIFMPNDKLIGLDINLNLHYTFDVAEKMEVYPLSGVAVVNNRFTGKTPDGVSKGSTDLGFNLGGGYSYHLNDNVYLNAEAKYMFSDQDSFVLGFGVGYKF